MKTMATAQSTWRKGRAPRKLVRDDGEALGQDQHGHEPGPELRPEERAAWRPATERTIQKAAPSAETAGKTKRTATAESTKAAMARFTKA